MPLLLLALYGAKRSSSSVQNSVKESLEALPVSVSESRNFFKRDFKVKKIKQALK